MHAAVHDPVTLEVLLSDRELGADLVLGGQGDGHGHRLDPSLGDRVHLRREILDHNRNPSRAKKLRVGALPTLTCLRSQCYRLRLQKSGSGSEALEGFDLPNS